MVVFTCDGSCVLCCGDVLVHPLLSLVLPLCVEVVLVFGAISLAWSKQESKKTKQRVEVMECVCSNVLMCAFNSQVLLMFSCLWTEERLYGAEGAPALLCGVPLCRASFLA